MPASGPALPERPIVAIDAVVHRAPLAVPVRTSFGTMHDRPALFLRVTDADGARGYGEVWCNFPSVGAEHRQRLAQDVVGPLVRALKPVPGGGIHAALMDSLHVLALQTGEWGPLHQVCAGFDMALHDLAARRAGVPLARLLAADAAVRVPAYASGIGPEDPAAMAQAARAAGHRAFKLKVGFGEATDRASLAAIRDAVGPDAALMVDANQRWTPDTALRQAAWMTDYGPAWLEEPVPADTPLAAWQALRAACPIPLAGGENLDAMARFDAALSAGIWRFVQPDAAKWGGVSGCLRVARAAQAAGAVYCPHYLGGAVGLLASAHLLAAAGGPGLLEMDVNPNPLRDDVLGNLLAVEDGTVALPEGPGLGLTPDHLFG